MAKEREIYGADKSGTKKEFDAHLDKASKTVASWPPWKREISSSYIDRVSGERKPKSDQITEK